MKYFQVYVTIMGTVMSLGYFPQAYKIWKNKSAKDISIPMYIIMSIGTLTWLIYGILVHDNIIIAGFVLGVIGSWLILFQSIYFMNKNN